MPIRIRESHVVLALLLCGLAAGAALNRHQTQSTLPPSEIEGLLWPAPPSLAPFKLITKDGQPFSEQDLQGDWHLMFFGFTHCPDVCPGTLRTLAALKPIYAKETGSALPEVIFVTVDPERDDMATLRDYVSFFDPAFQALTGTRESINALTRNVGIIAVPTGIDEDGDYSIDHTVSLLLVDPAGRLVGVLTAPHAVESLTPRIRAIVEYVTRRD